MKRRTIGLIIAFILLFINILVGCEQQLIQQETEKVQNQQSSDLPKEQKTEIKVHFLDVGQGDCSLIQLADGKIVLIDGGNRDDYSVIKGYLDSLDIKTIDYLIATHPHEDHIGALPKIIDNYDIGSIFMPKAFANTKIFESLLLSIKQKGLTVHTAKAGVNIIETEDSSLKIIAPNSQTYVELNNYSAVVQLTYKGTSYLFMGDAEKESEEELLNYDPNLTADIIKVGHHGGRTSTTEKFLQQVRPDYSILSLGKDNDYGHPHPETLARLKAINSQIYRTDEQGTIIATSDGARISINKAPIIMEKDQDIKVDYYIGNINSRIFHLKTCSGLPSSNNQIKLKSKAEAVEAGYSPCQRCKP